jgi:hypothetical protein
MDSTKLDMRARELATVALAEKYPEALAALLDTAFGRKWGGEMRHQVQRIQQLMIDEFAPLCAERLDELAQLVCDQMRRKLASREVVAAIDLVAATEHGVERSVALARLNSTQAKLVDEMKAGMSRIDALASRVSWELREHRMASARTYQPPNLTATDTGKIIDPAGEYGPPLHESVKSAVNEAVALGEQVLA